MFTILISCKHDSVHLPSCIMWICCSVSRDLWVKYNTTFTMYMYECWHASQYSYMSVVDMSAKKYVGLLEREGGLDVLRHIINLHGGHTILYTTAKAVIDRSVILVWLNANRLHEIYVYTRIPTALSCEQHTYCRFVVFWPEGVKSLMKKEWTMTMGTMATTINDVTLVNAGVIWVKYWSVTTQWYYHVQSYKQTVARVRVLCTNCIEVPECVWHEVEQYVLCRWVRVRGTGSLSARRGGVWLDFNLWYSLEHIIMVS